MGLDEIKRVCSAGEIFVWEVHRVEENLSYHLVTGVAQHLEGTHWCV